MKGGSVSDFIDHTTYEECAVLYHGIKYFFHGLIRSEKEKTYSYVIDVWDDKGCYVKTVFDRTAESANECMDLAQREPIFDGKNFWEAESDMEWVEW